MKPTETTSPESPGRRTLAINDIFSDSTGTRYRYLCRSTDGKGALVIELNKKTAWPKCWVLSDLVAKVADGTFTVAESQDLPVDFNPHKTDEKCRDERFAHIEELIENPGIFERSIRGPLVKKHALKRKISPTTLNTLLRDYWQGGQCEDALLTSYSEGNAKRQAALLTVVSKAEGIVVAPETKTDKPKARGAKRQDGSETYLLVGEERLAVAEFVRENFATKKTVTRAKLYRACMSKLYGYNDANGTRRLVPKAQRPSPKQVSWIVSQQVTLAAMVTKYKSVYELNNDYRAKTGSVTLHADFAGDVYEIDSTIVDLWLVARSNRRKTLGKATLYLVVDRLTRLIVGFNLSLDKPSWAGALEAFTSVFADKKALCKQWGAEYNPDVWIATGISCTRLAADRGSENLCYASDQVPDDLKVQVMNMPPHMSSFKGIVECSFKLVHVPLKDNSAGYEPPTNPFKRHGEKCYEKDASMTLDELAVELIDIIGMHNQMMLEQMELDSELVFDGVAPIPLEYWKADIKRQSGSARRMSEEFVRQQLMPRKSARVTQQGILVNHCFYTCPEAIQEEWFIRGKATKVVAEVSYHRGSVNAIYVRYPGRRGPPLVATLAPRSEQFQDWSVAEVYAFDWARRLARKEAAEHNLGLRIAQDARGVTRAKAHRSKTKAAIKAEPGVSRHAGAIEERALETRERTNDYVARTMGLNAETSVLAPHPAPASLPATQPASMPTAVATESSARSHAPAPEPQIDPTATAADLFEQLYNDD